MTTKISKVPQGQVEKAMGRALQSFFRGMSYNLGREVGRLIIQRSRRLIEKKVP